MRKLLNGSSIACMAAAVLGTVAVSAHAEAADYTKFNGVYVGLQGGYSSGTIELYEPRIGGMDVGISGFFGGVHAGYGHNIFNRLYLGAEVEHNWHKGSDGDAFIVNFEKKRDYSATVRLGFLAGEDTMIYGKGGLHGIEMTGAGTSKTAGGIKGGVGIEYLVWGGISVRAEGAYTYIDLDDDLKPWRRRTTLPSFSASPIASRSPNFP